MASKKERPVLVCTEFKGVFFGFATDTSGDPIHLKRARNCIYWDAKVGGFVGLAEKGPNANCKIGPTADMELRKITCIVEVSPEAERDARKWSGGSPVISHPPCRAWGSLRAMAKPAPGEKRLALYANSRNCYGKRYNA